MNNSPDTEVLQTARVWNFDAFLAATLAPASVSADLIAIAAFVGELDRIRQTVTEPAVAAIRIQWWQDELQNMTTDGALERGYNHPIRHSLARVILRHDLPISLFAGIADAVADQVSGPDLPEDRFLDAWLTRRHAAPFDLAVRCTGSSAHDAITDAGHAYGLARLSQAGSGLHTRPGTKTLHAATHAGNAKQALVRARAALRTRSGTDRLPFLPLALARLYLASPKAGADSVSPEPSRLRKVVRMASAHWLNRL